MFEKVMADGTRRPVDLEVAGEIDDKFGNGATLQFSDGTRQLCCLRIGTRADMNELVEALKSRLNPRGNLFRKVATHGFLVTKK